MNSVFLKNVRIILFLECNSLHFMNKLRYISFSPFCSAFHFGEFCLMLVGYLSAVKRVFEVCVVVCVYGGDGIE